MELRIRSTCGRRGSGPKDRKTVSGGGSDTDWSYDWVGNRLDNGWSYNQVDELSGFQYDKKGALTYDPSSTGDPRIHFQYGSHDLMAQIDREGSSPLDQTNMTWDADEQRLKLREEGAYDSWQFLYDTAAGIPAVLVERNADGDEETLGVIYYLREPGGELLARFGDEASVYYYHFNALGSTVMLSNASGTPQSVYAHGAWGDLLNSPAVTQPYQYVGRFGYYTHSTSQGSEISDWLQLGVRFYKPEIGRFERRDPILLPSSMYVYVSARLLTAADPWGYDLRKIPIIGPIIDAATEGMICIHESCSNNKQMKEGGGIRDIPRLDRPGRTKPGPRPPKPPPPGYEPPPGCQHNPYVCHSVDAINLPGKLDFIYHGVPQRPAGSDIVLKIPNLARCEIICNVDNPSATPDMYCTSDPKHPVCWWDPNTGKCVK